ncbi:MAG: segregation/condensation protein A [Parcubacteria group bacterium]|nr:segregation/condensation protein A [Parcubacteria group bacterium]
MFQVTQEKFSGPFEVLLGMIEGKKLEITEVSISQITSEFLAHVHELQEKNYTEIGDFLVVAARLIFIKSREILPKLIPIEEDDEGNLELQLQLYREIKRVSKLLAEIYLKRPMFGRGYFEGCAPEFLPGPNLTLPILQKSLLHFFTLNTSHQSEKVERRIVRIEERVAAILKRLESGSHFRLNELFGEKERIEVIVLFLALLELVKTGVVVPTQEGHFEDITVSRK